MCFGVALFGLILFGFPKSSVLQADSLLLSHLFGIFYASWTWMSVPFPKLRNFSVITSSNVFSAPFSRSSPSETPMVWMAVHLMLWALGSLEAGPRVWELVLVFCWVGPSPGSSGGWHCVPGQLVCWWVGLYPHLASCLTWSVPVLVLTTWWVGPWPSAKLERGFQNSVW